MNLDDSNLLHLYDGEVFDYKVSNFETLRISIEALVDDEATEEIYRFKDGEPVYPLIYENLTEKNPDLVKASEFILCIKVKTEYGFEGVGLAVVSKNWWIENSFHVNELSIAEDFQDLGLGTFLIRRIQTLAYSLKKDAVTLQCYKDEIYEPEEVYEAREKFYRQLGFEPAFDKLNQLMVYSFVGDDLKFIHL